MDGDCHVFWLNKQGATEPVSGVVLDVPCSRCLGGHAIPVATSGGNSDVRAWGSVKGP